MSELTLDAIRDCMEGAVPATLAGMLQSVSTAAGMDRVLALFGQGRFDSAAVSNYAGLLGGDGMEVLLRTGSSIAGSLFGPRQDAVAGVIANSASTRQSSAGSLLSAAIRWQAMQLPLSGLIITARPRCGSPSPPVSERVTPLASMGEDAPASAAVSSVLK